MFHCTGFSLGLFGASVAEAWQGILISGCGQVPARLCRLFCYTGLSLRLLGLVLIVLVNIETRSCTYGFKADVSNLYTGLSICRNFFTNVILAVCLASFNCHLTRNINSCI